MTFGEKLRVLRKEKGYSQEELAGMLYVSRQAVSKWESDRGMPETDKLIQISDMFGVTLDYLLKEECIGENNRNNGYYVSRETLNGFLSGKRLESKRLAIGFGLLVFSNFFGCFSDYRQFFLWIYWGMTAAGVSILIWHFLQPGCYHEIYAKKLIFDETVIKDFREESNRNRKRYISMIIAGVLLLLPGPQLSLAAGSVIDSELNNALTWLSNTVLTVLFILAGTAMHAEYIIAQNSEYIRKKNRQRKSAWIYIAIPVTGAAVLAGIVTNVWNPAVPIIILLCALLTMVCRLLMEGKNNK